MSKVNDIAQAKVNKSRQVLGKQITSRCTNMHRCHLGNKTQLYTHKSTIDTKLQRATIEPDLVAQLVESSVWDVTTLWVNRFDLSSPLCLHTADEAQKAETRVRC